MIPSPGTSCANHPDTPASAACDRCGRPVCNTCVVFDTTGAARCLTCASPAPVGTGSIPWERRAELGAVRAFVETVKVVLTRRQECLGPPASAPGLGAPLLFAVICHGVGTVFAVAYQLATTMFTMGGGLGLGESVLLGGLGVLGGPLLAAYWMFVWGGIVHGLLVLFGGARGGFEATARVQGYASATALFNVVPLVGGMVALGWSLVVQVIGLASAHGSGHGRSAAAVLAPMALCCMAAFAMVAFAAWGFTSMLPDQ